MKILPMHAMVWVHLEAPNGHTGAVEVIRAPSPIRTARVIACGPEVRDVRPEQRVVVNSLAGTTVGDECLVPESAILGTL